MYRVTAIDLSEKESVLSDRDSMSGYSDPCGAIEEDLHISGNDIRLKNELYQNYPNPFNPTTRVKYSLKDEGYVNISLYDITGRLVANLVNEFKVSGNYYLDFNATKFNLSSGIYFYKIQATNFTEIKQMILIK